MLKSLTSRLAVIASLALAASGAFAASFTLDSGGGNGLLNIYSATIDGGSLGINRTPCDGGSPSYCTFFGSNLASGVGVSASPNPSGLDADVPGGISPVPVAGSFIDLTLSGGNTSVTLNGGVVSLSTVLISIVGGTTVTATNAGWVFLPTTVGTTTTVDENGVAEFRVGVFSGPTVADFSTFTDVTSNCSGSFCSLLSLLNLDMNQYRLVLDFDPSFTAFTGSLIGQTNNNSLVYANLNAVPAPAAGWLLLTAVGGLVARRLKRAS